MNFTRRMYDIITKQTWYWSSPCLSKLTHCGLLMPYAGINLWMHPANERHCYTVTWSLIGWVHTQNSPCLWHQVTLLALFNVMVWHLSIAKTITWLMLSYFWLVIGNKYQGNFCANTYIFCLKMHLTMLSAKWCPCCLGFSVLDEYLII